MDPEHRTTDEMLAEIAGETHGVVARRHLLDRGITPDEIRCRVARGTLIPVHRGVFRVGHAAISTAAGYLAAVMACGDDAWLAGVAAGHLQRILKTPPLLPVVLTMTERRVRGVHTIRSRRPLTEDEAATVAGIPVTSVPRTLVDLAPLLTLDALSRACHETGILHKTTPAMVTPLARGRPGAAKLRAIISGEQKISLSRLETLFIKRLATASLPLPDEVNRPAGGRRVDCRWIVKQLTVELDSYAFHNTHHSWHQDRLREREAYARGDQHRRYTWHDVVKDPRAMLRELALVLLS